METPPILHQPCFSGVSPFSSKKFCTPSLVTQFSEGPTLPLIGGGGGDWGGGSNYERGGPTILTGDPTILVNEIIDTPLLVAIKTIKTLSM